MADKSIADLPDAFRDRTVQAVRFADHDAANPYHWHQTKKTFVLIVGLLTVLNSTLGTSLPANAAPLIGAKFGISDSEKLTLPITCYLIGYVVGPLLFAPLSELVGRRLVMISTFLGYFAFTLGCALAPTFNALCVFRFFSGVFASSPTAVIGGLYADIYANAVARGRAISGFMAVTTLGPVLGPIVSGFASTRWGWRSPFWIALILAGACLIPISLLPETFGPVLLTKKAEELRKATGNSEILSPTELAPPQLTTILTKVLVRPVRMFLTESIVFCTCLYLSLIYSIFYLFFEAYPIIFEGLYHLQPGPSGLAFLPIGIGALFSFGIFLLYDKVVRRAQASGQPWIEHVENRRLPLACLGGPLYAAAVFWLGWSANRGTHWIVPMVAGLPFGIGFLLIFMALINYLADAYGIYAASAMAAASTTRSVCGAVLPLATKPMYDKLGIHWATSLLGFLSVGAALIPWFFIKYGGSIRSRSQFALSLKTE